MKKRRNNFRTRIVMPVVDEAECVSKLADFLSENPHLQRAEVKFVRLLTPVWFNVPYSAPQALRMADEQEQAVAQAHRDLTVLVEQLEQTYCDLLTSVHVTVECQNGAVFAKIADQWNADFILTFHRRGNRFLELLFGDQLSLQILRVAKCPVHLINTERKPKPDTIQFGEQQAPGFC